MSGFLFLYLHVNFKLSCLSSRFYPLISWWQVGWFQDFTLVNSAAVTFVCRHLCGGTRRPVPTLPFHLVSTVTKRVQQRQPLCGPCKLSHCPDVFSQKQERNKVHSGGTQSLTLFWDLKQKIVWTYTINRFRRGQVDRDAEKRGVRKQMLGIKRKDFVLWKICAFPKNDLVAKAFEPWSIGRDRGQCCKVYGVSGWETAGGFDGRNVPHAIDWDHNEHGVRRWLC